MDKGLWGMSFGITLGRTLKRRRQDKSLKDFNVLYFSLKVEVILDIHLAYLPSSI
jgi:hypothetical protein